MFLAKVSANGQITAPAAIRRALRLDVGDKVLFIQNPDGEFLITKAATSAMTLAQHVAGQAPYAEPEDDPITRLIWELRGGHPTP